MQGTSVQRVRDSRTLSPNPVGPRAGVGSFVRWCRSAARLCAQRLLNDWAWPGLGWLAGWAGRPMQGRCQRVHRYCGSWVSLPLICGEVRIHTWFYAGCWWSCVTRGSHLPFFLMKWNPGTNGPKAKGGRYPGWPGRKGSGRPVSLLAAGPLVVHTVHHAPLAARPQCAAELVTLVV